MAPPAPTARQISSIASGQTAGSRTVSPRKLQAFSSLSALTPCIAVVYDPCAPAYIFFVITHMGQDGHNCGWHTAHRTIFISSCRRRSVNTLAKAHCDRDAQARPNQVPTGKKSLGGKQCL